MNELMTYRYKQCEYLLIMFHYVLLLMKRLKQTVVLEANY